MPVTRWRTPITWRCWIVRRLLLLVCLLLGGCVAQQPQQPALSEDALDLLRRIENRGMIWHTWSSYELLDNTVTWRDTGYPIERSVLMVGQRELWRDLNGAHRLIVVNGKYIDLVSIGCEYNHCTYHMLLTDEARKAIR
jgi:hypothetical protein